MKGRALQRMVVVALAVPAMLGIVGEAARADGDAPRTYELWLDAEQQLLQKHKPPLGSALTTPVVLTEGDTLVVNVDPSRLLPDEKTQLFDLGFAHEAYPAGVLGFYVAAHSVGLANPLQMQAGRCGIESNKKKIEAAKQALEKSKESRKKILDNPASSKEQRESAEKEVKQRESEFAKAEADAEQPLFVVAGEHTGACARVQDWALADGDLRGYLCHGDKTLAKLAALSTEWSMVEKDLESGKLLCHAEWTLGEPVEFAAVTIEVVHGGNAPEKIGDSGVAPIKTFLVPVRGNTRAVLVTYERKGGGKTTRRIEIDARARDTRSRLRVQAQLLATNRLRAVSFAVALTPVRRKFLTDGPCGCVFGCALTMSGLLRIAGEEKTLVQFGLAAGLNLVPAFQINGGLLFGTTDGNIAWRIERNWFLGIAIDPLILADAIAGARMK